MVTNTGCSPIKFGNQGDAYVGTLQVTYIRWVGATAAGHTLVIEDSLGNLVWSGEADGANFNDLQPVFQQVRGVNVATMTSGYILVYYR